MECKDEAIQIDLYEFLYGWHGQKQTGVLEINPEIRSGRKGGRVSWKGGEGKRRSLPGSPEALKERHDWKDPRMKKLEYLKLCKISKEATCPCGVVRVPELFCISAYVSGSTCSIHKN